MSPSHSSDLFIAPVDPLDPGQTQFDGGILRCLGRHVLLRLVEAALADVQARYDAGFLTRTVRRDQEGRFARGALSELATLFAVDDSRLRRYARVAEAIGPAEFSALLQMRDARGFPLTWSHFERLASVRGAHARQAAAVAAIQHGLTVRALAHSHQPAARQPSPNPAPGLTGPLGQHARELHIVEGDHVAPAADLDGLRGEAHGPVPEGRVPPTSLPASRPRG